MSIYKNTTVILLVSLIAVFSCSKKAITDTSNTEKEEIICSEEFVEIKVKLINNTNQSFILDSFKLILVKEGKDITENIEQNNTEEGTYTIMNDSFHKELLNTKTELAFIGYKGNTKVLEENYILSADQCHIYYVSGKKEMKINL